MRYARSKGTFVCCKLASAIPIPSLTFQQLKFAWPRPSQKASSSTEIKSEHSGYKSQHLTVERYSIYGVMLLLAAICHRYRS